MYYQEIKDVAKQPQILAALAGLINPATIIPALSIGVTGYAIIRTVKSFKNENAKLREDKKKLAEGTEYYEAEYEEIEGGEPYERLEQPLITASEPLEKPLSPTASNGSLNCSSTVGNMDDEALKKEMIRQAMSELGKRSAAVRARKRKP